MLFLNIHSFTLSDFSINQYNTNGQKEGLWIQKQKYRTTEIYYKEGLKSGICKYYDQNNRLLSLGEYQDDVMTGIWYLFYPSGHLSMILTHFKKNDKNIQMEDESYIYPNICYVTIYYPIGIKEEEGLLLFNDDPETDDTAEYGEWKYYNESGALIKTKVFK